MAAEFPYLVAINKLKPFLATIQDVGRPTAVTTKWLESIGYKSTNDRRLPAVLKMIGFTDQSGKPTQRWSDYRDKSRAPKVLAEGIREGYTELYHQYSNAHERNDTELKNFFSSRTGLSTDTTSRMVETFKILTSLADFSGVGDSVAVPASADLDVKVSSDTLAPSTGETDGAVRAITRSVGAGVAVNINIQLTVPDTTDASVYDNFFAALKKHLLS